MSDTSAVKKQSVTLSASSKFVEEAREKLEKAQSNMSVNEPMNDRGDTEFSIRSGSALKTLRISAASGNTGESVDGGIRAPKRAEISSTNDYMDMESEPVLMLTPSNKKTFQRSMMARVLHVVAIFASAVWIGLCASYITNDMGWSTLALQQPHLLGGFIAGILAPVAIIWMILAFAQRSSDIHMYAEALRGELQAMIFPSEERSQVIHKDIEELVRQAAELSTASKAVLKSLHKARLGLRSEIQGLSGISKKTEFHIDRLSENLSERSVKLLALTEEIEQRTSSIDEKTQAGADAWDQAALSVLERAAEMEAAMGKGATKLLDAADAAKDKTVDISRTLESSYDGLNSTVDAIAGRLEKLSGDFEQHKVGLASTTDHVAEQTSKLGDVLQGQIRDLETMTTRTVDSMTRAGATIQENREALDEGAKNLAAEAESIAQRLNGGVTVIQSAVDHISEKTETLEQQLQLRADSLRHVIDGMDSKVSAIETIGTETANKLSESMTVALSGAESIGSAVRRAIESLTRATGDAQKQAQDLIETTKTNIDQLNDAGAGNLENIQSIVDMLEKSRGQIQAASSLADEQVNKLSIAVEEQVDKINIAQATLTERVERVREALTSPLQAVSRAVADADIKHEAIASTLERRVKDLTDASDKATGNAEKIRDILRTQAQDISILAGQIAGHSRSISEHMSSQKNDLSQKVSDSLTQIETVRSALEEQSSRLITLSEGADTNIARLTSTIQDGCELISRGTQTAIGDLTSLEDKLEGRITTLKTAGAEAATTMETVAQSLEKTAGAIEPIYIRAVDQAKEAEAKLEQLRGDFDETTSSNLSRLREIGTIFDERLVKLKDGADEASSILVTSSDHLRDRAGDIEDAAASAAEKMRQIEKTLEDQSSDIHLTTDQALLKIEAVQKSINEQFHELSVSVGQAVAQLKDAGDEFQRQASQAEDIADKASGSFDEAGARALIETRKLKEAGDESVLHGKEMAAHVQREAEELLRSSQAVLSELKQAGDSFALRAREVAEQMKISLHTSREYGSELSTQADSVAEASSRTADAISKSVSVLTGTLGEVEVAAKGVSTKIETSRERLSEEAERLVVVSTKALKASEEASNNFSRHSNALFKAAQDAMAKVETIRENEWRVQRDGFLTAAKFVVESLHSLSVDVTRMLEGEIQEKTWKSYQKGDVAAFTRRLVEMGDRLPLDKIRDKYTGDSEFRNYVGRFVRQYEEVYDQAAATDHGDLLGSTFASSDVGKLYQILCATTGREPRKVGDFTRNRAA